jgi:hypothetical protein
MLRSSDLKKKKKNCKQKIGGIYFPGRKLKQGNNRKLTRKKLKRGNTGKYSPGSNKIPQEVTNTMDTQGRCSPQEEKNDNLKKTGHPPGKKKTELLRKILKKKLQLSRASTPNPPEKKKPTLPKKQNNYLSLPQIRGSYQIRTLRKLRQNFNFRAERRHAVVVPVVGLLVDDLDGKLLGPLVGIFFVLREFHDRGGAFPEDFAEFVVDFDLLLGLDFGCEGLGKGGRREQGGGREEEGERERRQEAGGRSEGRGERHKTHTEISLHDGYGIGDTLKKN